MDHLARSIISKFICITLKFFKYIYIFFKLAFIISSDLYFEKSNLRHATKYPNVYLQLSSLEIQECFTIYIV